MQSLRLFCDVVRCHSFSQAAAAHGISQSAASQRVSQLEKRLGVALIDRSVRPLELTEAGKTYYEGVSRLLDSYDQLEARVAGAATEQERGPVRVTAIYSAGIELLNVIRDRFEAERPQTHIEIHYRRPEDVHQAVREGECDLGIVSYPDRWPNVEAIHLRDETMVVAVRPDHPLAACDQVQGSQLSEHEMVNFENRLRLGRRIRDYLREQGASPEIVDTLDNIDSIKNVVSLTQRFAILPKRTIWRELEVGTLRAVALVPPLVRPIGVIYRRWRNGPDQPFSPAAQSFVDFLLKHAGPEVDVLATLDAAATKAVTPQPALAGQ